MTDLIKRQDAVNELSYCQTYLFDSRDHDKKISLEDAEYTIERLPSAQQWIPCSERLPEKPDTYIATLDYGKLGLGVGQRYYYDEDLGWNDDCVIAWMPLPEPYKGENDG